CEVRADLCRRAEERRSGGPHHRHRAAGPAWKRREEHAERDGLQAAGRGGLDAQYAADLLDVHRRAGVQVAEGAGRRARDREAQRRQGEAALRFSGRDEVLRQPGGEGGSLAHERAVHAAGCEARRAVVERRCRERHAAACGPSLRAVGRAGAGVNNIPVPALSKRGIPVFNAPGANANAVKELVLAGMLIAARNLGPALEFVKGLDGGGGDIDKTVESGKKAFAGFELPGHTLGVIGLGKIGSLVADAAIRLGMNVQGYDPHITVEAAWSLPSQVRRANSIDEILKGSDFVSLHVPLVEKTKHLVNTKNIDHFRSGAVLLNFSREGVVSDEAVLKGLSSHRLKCYVTDFPSAALIGKPGVIALPHLGASTAEAEDNSAVMVVDQLREYLEHGNLQNAVNFPDASMAREAPYRLAIANANVPDMLGRLSNTLC